MKRLKLDWDKLVPTMRKPWTFKDAQLVHACCGLFNHLMSEFKKAVPTEDFEAMCDSLEKQFELGYLDPELEGFLVRYLPPANLHDVSFLKTLGLRNF